MSPLAEPLTRPSLPSGPGPGPGPALAPAILGALLCFALLLFFGAVASGVGLVSFKLERGQFPHAGIQRIGAVYGFIVIIVSFFVGGFTSARFARPETRAGSIWSGLGSWSVVVVSLAFLIGSFASSVSSFLVEAGVGAGAAAGAAGTVDEITSELSKVRIVTDMKILKGRAVTQFEVPRPKRELAGVAAQEAPREMKSAQTNLTPSPKTKREAVQMAGTARSMAGEASLVIAALLLIGAFASAWGGATSRSSWRAHARL